MKIALYESDTLEQDLASAWQDVKPLYDQLHAYVRHKLHLHHGDEVMEATGLIPAHLLGDIGDTPTCTWCNIANFTKPYPKKSAIDVSEAMIKQGWKPETMFKKADDFIHSLGLKKVPASFWTKSHFEKNGIESLCSGATSWDFYDSNDYRVSSCTEVSQDNFNIANAELSGIQYQMQFSNQSFLYRKIPTAAFHGAVGFSLSAIPSSTPDYFQQIGLLGKDVDIADKETNINLLFSKALTVVIWISDAYLLETFRFDLLSGRVPKEDMNCHFWKLKSEIHGLRPAMERNNQQFDVGKNIMYGEQGQGGEQDWGFSHYFMDSILRYQFYQELCLVSGRYLKISIHKIKSSRYIFIYKLLTQVDTSLYTFVPTSGKYVKDDPGKPLHQCNYYGSKEAGDKIGNVMKMGASRPWKDVLELMTGN